VKVEVARPGDLGPPEISRWMEIQAAHPALASPFLSPHFAMVVGRARPGARVAIASDSTGIIGFLPYERRRLGFGTALAQGLSDIQAVIAPPTAEIDLGALLRGCGLRVWEFDHLLAHQEGWTSGAAARLAHERSPAIDLSAGWDAYEQARRVVSSSLFQSTARKRRKLERTHGPVRLVFDQADRAALEQVLRWKSEQYRRTGRRDRFADAGTRALIHDLFDLREPSFGAPLTVLFAGDTIVAGHLGLRSATILAWWFPVYDPNFAAFSPGLVTVLDLARAMTAEGLSLFDLGKGDEPYKDRLSNTEIPLLRGSVARDRATAAIDGARRWPQEWATEVVLRSPRMRSWARSALNRVGAVRTRLGARRGS
jgi:CelD/BcsL family acetyltransferase involved in cellulose biosynthesis